MVRVGAKQKWDKGNVSSEFCPAVTAANSFVSPLSLSPCFAATVQLVAFKAILGGDNLEQGTSHTSDIDWQMSDTRGNRAGDHEHRLATQVEKSKSSGR